MEKNKSNLGLCILIVLLIVVICFLVCFILFRKKDNVIVDDNVMTSEEALSIGYDLYDKVSDIYIHHGGDVDKTVSSDGDVKYVYYIKNSDGSFSTSETNNFNGTRDFPYVKLVINDFRFILSDDMFKDFCSEFSISEYQGSYYRVDGDRGSIFGYAGTELKVVSISNDKLVFDAVSSYYLNYNDAINSVPITEAQIEVKTNRFELIFENGIWKVNKFTMAY